MPANNLQERLICPRCPLPECQPDSVFCGLAHYRLKQETRTRHQRRNADACRRWYAKNRDTILAQKKEQYEQKKQHDAGATH